MAMNDLWRDVRVEVKALRPVSAVCAFGRKSRRAV